LVLAIASEAFYGLLRQVDCAAAGVLRLREDELPILVHFATETLYVVSFTTGLRIGEALGLRWSDIKFDLAGTALR